MGMLGNWHKKSFLFMNTSYKIIKKSCTSEAQKMKRNLRASKAWKDLQRKKKIHQQGYCAVLMTKLTKTANLHHLNLDATKYTDLSNEDDFVFLSNKVHECVHLLYGSKCGWRNAVGRLIAIFEKMDKVNKQIKLK